MKSVELKESSENGKLVESTTSLLSSQVLCYSISEVRCVSVETYPLDQVYDIFGVKIMNMGRSNERMLVIGLSSKPADN